jgi:hypothetical protein
MTALYIKPLTKTANQYTAYGTHLHLNTDEVIELTAARLDKDDGVKFHSKPATLLAENRWTASLRVEPVPPDPKDIGEYHIVPQTAPRSLLNGRGSVVAVDLAGGIDPAVRAGS